MRLDPAESHHLVRVRRARRGDSVELIDGRGARAQATLQEADGRAAALAITDCARETPPPWRLTLAQALPKGKSMDAVVQRATELGADRIAPLFTAQSEVALAPDRVRQKQEKWQQTALESAKQCGSPWLPEIRLPETLSDFLQRPESRHGQRLVAALTPASRRLRSVLAEQPPTNTEAPLGVTLLVGPEGDFSLDEYTAIFAAGFQPVTLGPRVLRVETAACALLALVLDALRG